MQQIHGPLMVGSSGTDVRIVQESLNRTHSQEQIVTDGMFGAHTEAAVRGFQKLRNLVCDGIVGPRTAAALGLGYVALAPVQSVSEIRRRQLRAASDPDDLPDDEHELAASGVDEQGGAAQALAAAVISCYTRIVRRLKLKIKNTSGVSKAHQILMTGMLVQCYARGIGAVSLASRSPDATTVATSIVNSTCWWGEALCGCSVLLNTSAALADQQLAAKFRLMGARIVGNGGAAAAKARALFQGSGERLDLVLPAIMAKLTEAIR